MFNNKLIVKVQNYMKTNGENYKSFSKYMHSDVHYYPAKFEIKIQVVYGEIKKGKLYYESKMD